MMTVALFLKSSTFGKSSIILFVSWLFLCQSCRTFKESDLDGFGLEIVSIKIDNDSLAKLNKTIASKVGVPATIRYGENERLGLVSYSGQSTLYAFKKSYQFEFKQDNLFLGRSAYRLSSQASDSTGLRALIGFHIYEAFGVPSPSMTPISLYVNNEYKGLYFLLENVDDEFFEQRQIQIKNLYKAKFGNADFSPKVITNLDEAFSIRRGSDTFTSDLENLVKLLNESNDLDTLEKELPKQIDINNYFAYLSSCAALANWDGHKNNYFLYRRKLDDKFAFTPWDLDKVYDNDPRHNQFISGVTIYGDTVLSSKLMEIPRYKSTYHQILKSHIQSTVNAKDIEDIFQNYKSLIGDAAKNDRVLNPTQGYWERETETLKKLILNWYNNLEAEVSNL